jgi:F-type H+-transporting ATPase subunit gamma
METLEHLRRRLRAARDVATVVATMKGLAAVNVRHDQRAALATGDYLRTIELGLQGLLREDPDLLRSRPDRHGRASSHVLLVLGSDQGLCGPINRHVAARAVAEVQRRALAPGERVVVAVGLRVAHELDRVGLTPTEERRQVATAEAIGPHVLELVVDVDAWRRTHAATEVLLVHPEPLPHGPAAYRPRVLTLWPLDPRWLAALGERPWPTRQLPTHRAAADVAFGDLLRQWMVATLSRGLAETLAAVEASRLLAMQAAEHNLEERIEDLHQRFHRQRQAAITAELLDVIAGADAVG